MEFMAILCMVLAVLCLLWAGWIDLKLWILPNELVLAVALLSLFFHFFNAHMSPDWISIAVGGIVGGGALWVIRAVANYIYGMETLGLGDVKLMAAVGLWLGSEGVFMALSVGSFCGVLHALSIAGYNKYVRGQDVSLHRMALPAGPGFIAGSLLVAIFTFKELWS